MTMVYSYNYDSDYHPSMPMIELSLGLPLSETAIEVRAIVDSGADATMIPARTLQEVGARRSRKALMRGVSGVGTLVDLYAVAVPVSYTHLDVYKRQPLGSPYHL